MPFELLNPKGLERPVGYAHVAKVTGGNIVYVAGQAPFDENGQVVGKGDFVAQFAQVIQNLKIAVAAAGGRPDQYAVLTIYITDLQAYLSNKTALGGVYREVFGKYFPAITLVQVGNLYNPDCMIEISGIAVLD
ncbi:MAG TPA: RidA family protein [Candidatus Binatia bacterium]|jgi:enamine deaminase RidA (YjgF/YER057c/UK114 family)|nr:RidA family protein [Candidatus Binatia bacterium]